MSKRRLKIHNVEVARQSINRLFQTDGALTLKALVAEATLTKGCLKKNCSEERNDRDST
jgi:hypothetical protein